MKPEELSVYMQAAESFATLSKAVRKKVGAVLVTKQGLVIPGVNGTVSGGDNNCEYLENGVLITKPTVLHAELNCILKCAKEGVSCVDAELFATLSPCPRCSAMIAQAGVRKVYYRHNYRDLSGIEYLKANGVEVEQLEMLD